MTSKSGGGFNGGCEAAAAANGRGEYAMHISRASSMYSVCNSAGLCKVQYSYLLKTA